MRNARFWAYVSPTGPVKITLRPGQTLTHCRAERTDEGWSSETNTWTYPKDEPTVYRQWCDDGRDCDGRLTNSGEDQCPLADLAAGHESKEDGVTYPAWDRVSYDRYDEFAQAAGY